MSEPDMVRVGDDERSRAVAALGEHFALGRLDQEEYDTRTRAAYASRTIVDLRRLFTDLPDPAPFRPAPGPAYAAGRAARDVRRRMPPAVPLVLIFAVFVTVSAVVRFPVVPLLFLMLFVAWRTGAIGPRSHRAPGPWGPGRWGPDRWGPDRWDRRALR